MNYENALTQILDAGAEMVRCGGETHRVEDSVYRMASALGFEHCSVWVVPSNVQATVTDPEGRVLTQLRHIRGSGIDFDTLSRLNALSRWICAEKPEDEAVAARMEEIRGAAKPRAWLFYLAAALGGTAFGLFFGCDWLDSITAALASLLICFLIRRLSPKEGNPLILNFTVSFCTELLILLSARLGLVHNMGCITVGVVMLLISGLGATNGLRDLVHLDTLSGLINIVASVTGAIGIALGIALPLLIFRAWSGNEVSGLNQNELIQILAVAVACVGFSLWFRVRGVKILWCALGSVLCWGVYLLCYDLIYPSVFGATLLSSVICGLYGQIMARLNRAPATIFTTICLLPLIPGSSLYYAVYGVVTRNSALASSKAADLGLTCFAIVLGFMVVEVVNRFLWRRRS